MNSNNIYKIITMMYCLCIIPIISFGEICNYRALLQHQEDPDSTQLIDKIHTLPKEYILTECTDLVIKRHFIRINNSLKKYEQSMPVNYLRYYIAKEIDYQTFLIKYHNYKIEKAATLFLFQDEQVFKCVYNYLSRNENQDKNMGNIRHEKEHYDKASQHGVEVFYSIIINILNRDVKETKFNITPSVFAFVEKNALQYKWSLYKYLSVCKDILIVNNMSKDDSLSIKTIEAIEREYSKELQ